MPFVGIPSGIIADKLIASKKFNVASVRKLFQIFGTFLPALFLILMSVLKPNTTQAVVFMIIALACSSFTTAGHNANFLDLTTKYTGILYAFSNTTATIPGIIGVSVTGYILDHSNHNWTIIFLLAAFIFLIPGITFIFLAKGEEIDFGDQQNYVQQVSEFEGKSLVFDGHSLSSVLLQQNK